MRKIPYSETYKNLDGTCVASAKRDILGYAEMRDKEKGVPELVLLDTYGILRAISVSVPKEATTAEVGQKLTPLMMQVERSQEMFTAGRSTGDVRLTEGMHEFLFVLMAKIVGDTKRCVGQHIFGDSWDLIEHQLRGTKPKVEGLEDLWKDQEAATAAGG